jgi:hypothetical protein
MGKYFKTRKSIFTSAGLRREFRSTAEVTEIEAGLIHQDLIGADR